MMFVGALEAILRKCNLRLDDIKGCIGTSAGALTAFWIAAGMSFEKFLELALEFDHFNVAPKMDVALLVNHYGMDEGEKLLELIESAIKSTGMSKDITFSELFRLTKRHFVCVVSNLDTQKAVYLDHSSNPDMEVKQAIRISMGLPLIFPPSILNGTYYVDGAITDNYPIDYFPIKETLIFGICPEAQTVRTWKEYGISVLECGLTSQKRNLSQRLKDLNLHAHLIDLEKPAFDVKLTEIRRDVAVFGFYYMLLIICPQISIALDTIVLDSIMRFLRILNTKEDTQSYNEAYSECEIRLLEG